MAAEGAFGNILILTFFTGEIVNAFMIIYVILHANFVLKCLSTLNASEVFRSIMPYQVSFHKLLGSSVLTLRTFESDLFWMHDHLMHLQHVLYHVRSSEESLIATSYDILTGNLDVLPVLLHMLFKGFR